MTTANFTSDATTIYANPERGPRWRDASADFLDDPGNLVSSAYDCYNGRSDSGGAGNTPTGPMRLMLCALSLPSGAISSGQLANIQTSFNTIRTQGVKTVLIPRYDSADSGLSTMLSHAAQLAPVLEANKDVIFTVHAGFLGQYGEWATPWPTALSVANKTAVKDAILAMTPNEIAVEFTNPFMMNEVWFAGQAPITALEAFSGSSKSRMGFFDDCFLTGQGDSHTYWAQGSSVNGYTVQSTPQAQRAYMKGMGRYAPFGGETCDDGQGYASQARLNGQGYTIDAASGGPEAGGILAEGPAYYMSDLNRSFALVFWNTWASEGTTYNTVYRNMGYRIQYDSVTHAASISRAGGNVLMVSVDLRNTGWSIAHDARRRVMATLDDGAGHVLTGFSYAQLRQLPPQASSSTRFLVPVPIPSNAAIATYSLKLEMRSGYPSIETRRDYKIRNANANSGGQTWDDSNGRWNCGTTVGVTA